MKIFTSYSVKIKHYNHVFKDTVKIYRKAVDFLIGVCVNEWDDISCLNSKKRINYVEHLCHATKENPFPKYDFDSRFYKMPTYIRRAAISEAIGKVSSYKSNLANWKSNPIGREPSISKAGYVYPSMYRDNMYNQTDTYKAELKVYVCNTWDWIEVDLRKSDIDYITRYCGSRRKCAPTLQKRGKEWFLDFPFEEDIKLCDTDIQNRTIVAVDLGINSAATVSIMNSDGTILGRHFLKLSKEQDSLKHSINRIKKAQQHCNHRTPRLWAKAKGINHDIAVKTAHFIIDVAVLYNADAIVFEYLELSCKKQGFKKQKLHMWKSRYVQSIVANKAHRLGIRISHVNAWNTSKLAYDGSGVVERGKYIQNGIERYNYSICTFPIGKQYHCDLNASYNIGARYFIRELLKSLDVSSRLQLEAKVPQVCKRSTCTLSTLISLNAVLMSA